LAICWDNLFILLKNKGQSAGNLLNFMLIGILRDYTPKSINYKLNPQFCSYLTGLIEGDGTIIVPITERNKKGKLNYPSIQIVFDSRDLPLALIIQKTMGLCTLSKEKGKNCIRLNFNNNESILLLINILNGNMRTPKIYQLYLLIDFINHKYNFNIIKLPLDNSNLFTNS
jgi:hypothetical protein